MQIVTEGQDAIETTKKDEIVGAAVAVLVIGASYYMVRRGVRNMVAKEIWRQRKNRKES